MNSQSKMEVAGGETKLCSNCKREIAATNFVMHEMHCRRHIVLCEHCQEPVPRSETEEHFNEFHATVPCEKCKLKITKDKMEKHISSECERRPLPCGFCELSFPKNEFDSHTDFCGSRTECCPVCRQYIMLKDMWYHEKCGCSPPPPPQAAAAPDLDPFSMMEMNQFLGEDSSGASIFPDLPSNVLRGHERNGEHRSNLSRGERERRKSPSKNGARGGRRGVSVRKKTDVNVQRGNNLSNEAVGYQPHDVTLPHDMDYDTLLALQLSHDALLHGDQIETDGTSHVTSSVGPAQSGPPVWGRNSAGVEQIIRDNRTYNDLDDATIPCEFCEQEVPLEDYMDHVECCPLSGVGSNGSAQQDMNNEVSSTTSDRPSIPVINNLGTPLGYQAFQPLSEEEYILPCEFCEEVFPLDVILQHQSVCPANGMATPRVMTPASSQPRYVSAHSLPTSRSNGQMSEQSLLDFVDDLDEHHFGEQRVPEWSSNKYSAPVDRFDDAIARPPRRSARPNLVNDTADQHASGDAAARVANRETSSNQHANVANGENSNAHRANVARKENSSTQHTRVARRENSSTQHTRVARRENSSTQQSREANREDSSTQHSRRVNSSTQRARAVLNQLLQDDEMDAARATSVSNAIDALRDPNTAHPTASLYTAVSERLKRERGLRPPRSRQATASTRRESTPRSISYTDSDGVQVFCPLPVQEPEPRIVRRPPEPGPADELRRELMKAGKKNSNRTGTNGANAPRNRQRADHVFSPELRVKKPDHNGPRPRKN